MWLRVTYHDSLLGNRLHTNGYNQCATARLSSTFRHMQSIKIGIILHAGIVRHTINVVLWQRVYVIVFAYELDV